MRVISKVSFGSGHQGVVSFPDLCRGAHTPALFQGQKGYLDDAADNQFNRVEESLTRFTSDYQCNAANDSL